MGNRRAAVVSATLLLVAQGSASSQSGWSVDTKPVTVVNAVSPEGQVSFMHVVAAARLADGTIVVGDDHDGLVRFFDVNGRLQRAVGGRGSGPSEFRHIWWLGRCGSDSVYVWDFMQRRMKVVSPTGTVVRQYIVPADSAAAPVPHVVSCSVSGVFAYQSEGRPGPSAKAVPPFLRGSAPVWIVDGTGRRVREIVQGPATEMVILGGGAAPRPLGKSTSIALSRSHLYVGTADSAYLQSFPLRNGEPFTIPVVARRQAADRPHHERAVNKVIASVHGPPPQMIERIKQQLLALPTPEWLPPYDQVLVDVDDNLWTVVNTSIGAGTNLHIYSARGREMAQVRIPLQLKVFEIGRDYVLGVAEDDVGEQKVIVFRLRRPPH